MIDALNALTMMRCRQLAAMISAGGEPTQAQLNHAFRLPTDAGPLRRSKRPDATVTQAVPTALPLQPPLRCVEYNPG
jgi:hypothetical protein